MTVLNPGEQVSVPVPPAGEETREERMLRLAKCLLSVGVSEAQTRHLLINYDLDVIEQQLVWLPARTARKKSSLIVTAIRENYEKPASLME